MNIPTRPAHPRRPSRGVFLRRQLVHLMFSLAVLLGSLALGMWGYRYYEHIPWRDAFLNAAMILGGMGPVKQDLSEPGSSSPVSMPSIRAWSSSP